MYTVLATPGYVQACFLTGIKLPYSPSIPLPTLNSDIKGFVFQHNSVTNLLVQLSIFLIDFFCWDL